MSEEKKTIIEKLSQHKGAAIVLGLIVLIVGYYGIKKLTTPPLVNRYVMAAVQKGTLVVSVSGSGQTSVTNQVDVKPNASGDLTKVSVVNGQTVKAGQVLGVLNQRDALKALRDAQTSLQSARLNLEKLKQPVDNYTIIQAQNALTAARSNLEKLKFSQPVDYQKALDAKQTALDDQSKAYEEAFNDIANAFLNLPDIITQLNEVLTGYEIGRTESSVGGGQQNTDALMNTTHLDYRDALIVFQRSAENDYTTARNKYTPNFDAYKSVTRYSDRDTMEKLLVQTLETTKSIAQAAKSQTNYLAAWADYRAKKNWTTFAQVTTFQADLSSDIVQTNGHLSTLLAIQRTLQADKEAVTSAGNAIKQMDQNNPLDLKAAESDVKEKAASLAKLQAGTDPLDIQSQEISVRQAGNNLLDAQQKMSDYTITAPFDGIVAKVNSKKGDPVSSGTVFATLITSQRTAEISLNEVDVAKVQVGQKATLTFDAIDGLSITGEVAEIDTLGTVAQGVVTYTVKIIFDTQDDRVKPGMSVSAAIITDEKSDVLTVPGSAVKSNQDGSHYVEMFNPPLPAASDNTGMPSATPPAQQTVEIGLSNDSTTEITSGLKEGDPVVTRTIVPTTATATTAPSLFGGAGARPATGGGGGGGGGGNPLRALGR